MLHTMCCVLSTVYEGLVCILFRRPKAKLTVSLACLDSMSEGVSEVESGSYTTFPLICRHNCCLVQTRLLYGICPCLQAEPMLASVHCPLLSKTEFICLTRQSEPCQGVESSIRSKIRTNESVCVRIVMHALGAHICDILCAVMQDGHMSPGPESCIRERGFTTKCWHGGSEQLHACNIYLRLI